MLHLLALFFLPSAVSFERNITIDDQAGDGDTGQVPAFSPRIAWATQTCSGCAIKPDVTQMHDETFTAATFMPDKNIPFNSIDFTFNGTAVYIFFTLFNFEGEGVTVNTECNFTIDGQHVGYFKHTGDRSRPFQRDYQVPVFSKTGLEQAPHHMNISMSDVKYHVFLSFDYAVYTQTEPDRILPPPEPQSSHTAHTGRTHSGAIIGGAIGGLCVLLGLSIFFWLYHRSKRRHVPAVIPEPFSAPVLDPAHPSSPHRPTNQSSAKRLLSSVPPPRVPPPQFIQEGSTVATTSEKSSSPPSPMTSSRGYQPQDTTKSVQGPLAPIRRNQTGVSSSHSSSPSDERRGHPRTAPTGLTEEIRRLRAELRTLRQNVTRRQLVPQGDSEPPPTYSVSGSSSDPCMTS